MKKQLLPLMALLCLATACEKIDTASETADASADNSNKKTRDVQFVIKGLDVDYGSTRATVTSEGMTDLWVWEGTTLLKHQTSDDSDFGTPTVTLTIGAHDLTFVTSKSEGQTWTDGQWTCTKVKDTFGTVLSYTVSSSSSSKQVGLDRVNGKLKWTIEDAIPATATTANVSVPQCYGLDASLNGKSKGTHAYTFDISSMQGVTGVMLSSSVLPEDHTNGSTISPTITITDGTDNICSYTNEVTITANVVTNIHGSFFSNGGGLTFTLNSDWGTQNDVSLR